MDKRAESSQPVAGTASFDFAQDREARSYNVRLKR